MRRLAALAVVSLGCSPQATTCPSGVLVVASDEATAGETGVLPLDGTPAQMLGGAGSDPALATSAGRRFLVDRRPGVNLMFELDSCGHATWQYSTLAPGETNGDGTYPSTDPQDVAVAPDGTLWVARLSPPPAHVPSLLVIGSPPTTIDMSAFDSDGNPDASSVRIIGGRAFVALERLNPYPTSSQPSQIAVLDATTKALVTTITLKGRNPFGLMVESPGELWLAEPGSFYDASEPDAGIEVVDTSAMTSSLLISETTLGASVAEVAVGPIGAQAPGQGKGCAAAIVADPSVSNKTSLVSFALDGSHLATAMGPTDGFDLHGLAWTADGKLLVGDQRPSGAGYPVHVFSAGADCALTPGADLSLPDLPALAFAP